MKTVKTCLFASLLGSLFCSIIPVEGNFSHADGLKDIATPVSNPVNFEDPRIRSEIRPIYLHHEIDKNFVTGGGQVDLYALQLRYALTDRLALIATKDGIVNFQPKGVLNDGSGLANVAGGVKYALYDCADSIASVGLRYEAPVGDKEVLQGKGSGIINPFVSGAYVAGPLNFMGYTGMRVPFDDSDSMFYDASLHVDTKLGMISPLAEVHLFHVLDDGDRLPIADEGQDLLNLGAANAKGKTMVTGALGARIALLENVSVGAAYEVPLTQGSGTYISDWRVTSDLVVTFQS